MIIQNEPVSEGAAADMSFTVPRTDLRAARAALDPVVGELGDRARSPRTRRWARCPSSAPE